MAGQPWILKGRPGGGVRQPDRRGAGNGSSVAVGRSVIGSSVVGRGSIGRNVSGSSVIGRSAIGGRGTSAEGWIRDAAAFWEARSKKGQSR